MDGRITEFPIPDADRLANQHRRRPGSQHLVHQGRGLGRVTPDGIDHRVPDAGRERRRHGADRRQRPSAAARDCRIGYGSRRSGANQLSCLIFQIRSQAQGPRTTDDAETRLVFACSSGSPWRVAGAGGVRRASRWRAAKRSARRGWWSRRSAPTSSPIASTRGSSRTRSSASTRGAPRRPSGSTTAATSCRPPRWILFGHHFSAISGAGPAGRARRWPRSSASCPARSG